MGISFLNTVKCVGFFACYLMKLNIPFYNNSHEAHIFVIGMKAIMVLWQSC